MIYDDSYISELKADSAKAPKGTKPKIGHIIKWYDEASKLQVNTKYCLVLNNSCSNKNEESKWLKPPAHSTKKYIELLQDTSVATYVNNDYTDIIKWIDEDYKQIRKLAKPKSLFDFSTNEKPTS